MTSTRSGVTHTVPALTAIDLVPELGGDAIDNVLRTGASDLPAMYAALAATKGRAGNQARARLLLDSRDLPWSAAERLLHRILRESGLRGWATNQALVVDGQQFYVDVLFSRERVVVEVDGWEWHGRRMVDFQKTMHRHSTLEAAGWRVLHFTFGDLQNDAAWVVETIETALSL